MPGWSFWEWLTYACIGIAALVIAFDQGVKLSKARERFATLIGSPIWAFAPIALFLSVQLLLPGYVFCLAQHRLSISHNPRLFQLLVNSTSLQIKNCARQLIPSTNKSTNLRSYIFNHGFL